MAINYPTSLDTLTNPTSADTVAGVDHAVQHANANDAIEALEAKLGTGSSTATANTVLRGTGSGATAFQQVVLTTDVTGTLPAANGGASAPATIQMNAMATGNAPSSAAFNSGWTRMFVNKNGAATMAILKNPGGSNVDSFVCVNEVAITPTKPFITYDSGTSKFYGIANAGTTVYQWADHDSTLSEASMTFSGTAVTAAQGIASDGTNIYVLDNDGGTKKLRKYSVSGTTLTHVSNTTLDTNDPDKGLAISGSSFYAFDSGNVILYKFNSSGVTQSSFTLYDNGPTATGGICVDASGGFRVIITPSLLRFSF